VVIGTVVVIGMIAIATLVHMYIRAQIHAHCTVVPVRSHHLHIHVCLGNFLQGPLSSANQHSQAARTSPKPVRSRCTERPKWERGGKRKEKRDNVITFWNVAPPEVISHLGMSTSCIVNSLRMISFRITNEIPDRLNQFVPYCVAFPSWCFLTATSSAPPRTPRMKHKSCP